MREGLRKGSHMTAAADARASRARSDRCIVDAGYPKRCTFGLRYLWCDERVSKWLGDLSGPVIVFSHYGWVARWDVDWS